MALSGSVLGAAMKAACTMAPNEGESMDAFRNRLFEAMATAIVDHITANAEVSVSVPVPSTPTTASGTGTVS